MFNSQLISSYFQGLQIKFNQNELDDVVLKANSLSSFSPSERLDYILKNVDGAAGNVSQTSLSAATDSCFPGLVFLDLRWVLVTKKDENTFSAKCFETGCEFEFSIDRAPVTVIMWIKESTRGLARNALSDIQGEQSQSKSKSLIKRLISAHPRWVLDVCLATLMINIFAVVTSLFAMQVYDRVVPTLAFSTLYSLVAGVFLVYIIDFILKTTRSRVLDKNSSRIDKALSEYVFDHLLQADLDKLPRQLGTLTSQISGLDGIRHFFTSSIVFALIDLPFALLFLGVMYVIGGPIAFVYLFFLVTSIVIGIVAQKRSQKANKELTQRSNEKMGVLVDAIKGAETIRSSGSARRFANEWKEILNAVASASLVQKGINTYATSFSQSMGSISYAIAIMVGVHQISLGHLTMGAMIACSILGGRVLGPVGQAVGYLIQYEGVRQSISLVDSFLEVPRNRAGRENLVFPTAKPAELSVEDLEFSYQGASVPQVSVERLNFRAGDRVAVLGGIGSGKSTLLKVLAGLMKSQKGRIRASGVDLWELDPDFLSANISYLPQSPDLFRGSLKENINLGSRGTDSRVTSIINKLQLNKIYAHNDKGLDMEISEGGSGLSGGQRQMVGLARVFINAPAIWILDEPTASLDSGTQELVVRALMESLKPKDILIFATHNLKLATDLSNRILVLENGKVHRDVPTSSVEVRRSQANV